MCRQPLRLTFDPPPPAQHCQALAGSSPPGTSPPPSSAAANKGQCKDSHTGALNTIYLALKGPRPSPTSQESGRGLRAPPLYLDTEGEPPTRPHPPHVGSQHVVCQELHPFFLGGGGQPSHREQCGGAFRRWCVVRATSGFGSRPLPKRPVFFFNFRCFWSTSGVFRPMSGATFFPARWGNGSRDAKVPADVGSQAPAWSSQGGVRGFAPHTVVAGSGEFANGKTEVARAARRQKRVVGLDSRSQRVGLSGHSLHKERRSEVVLFKRVHLPDPD